jgi:hypothetical protein
MRRNPVGGEFQKKHGETELTGAIALWEEDCEFSQSH